MSVVSWRGICVEEGSGMNWKYALRALGPQSFDQA